MGVCVSQIAPQPTDTHCKFGEFNAGLKNTKKAHLYSIVFMLRRGLFTVLLVTLSHLPNIYLVVGMSSIQVLYTVFLIVVRPFDGHQENVIEILNELFFSLLVGMLFNFNTASKWSSSIIYSNATTTYVWIMMANNLAIVSIIIVGFIVKLAIKFKSKKTSLNKIQQDHEALKDSNNSLMSSNIDTIKNAGYDIYTLLI